MYNPFITVNWIWVLQFYNYYSLKRETICSFMATFPYLIPHANYSQVTGSRTSRVSPIFFPVLLLSFFYLFLFLLLLSNVCHENIPSTLKCNHYLRGENQSIGQVLLRPVKRPVIVMEGQKISYTAESVQH